MSDTAATSTATVEPTNTPPAGDTPAGGDRPAWLPDKFKSPEELVKAYGELETKLGQPKKEDPAPSTPAANTPAGITAEAAKAAGIDMNALSTEFANTGALSEETLAALNEKGFDKAMVDNYIAGQQAIAEQLSASLVEMAGGKDKLDALLGWANTNLTKSEHDAYNKALDSGDMDLVKLTLQGIQSKYSLANGKEPNLVTGSEGTGVTGVKPFGTNAEISLAMRDPRYGSDPSYRKEVEARLNVTNIW